MSKITTKQLKFLPKRPHSGLLYYTGRPCKNGHLAARYSSSGHCQDCLSARNALRKVSAQEKGVVEVKLRAKGLPLGLSMIK